MNLLQFYINVDDDRIVQAIRDAEAHISGEIRVYIAAGKHPDPYEAAVRKFNEMRMFETRERNAVLLYIAPRSQTFAIVGDEAIHARCGQQFWLNLRDEMTRAFAADEPTEAIIRGIARAAALLAAHFPRRGDDRNELDDALCRGQ